jgi:hypothetical protein
MHYRAVYFGNCEVWAKGRLGVTSFRQGAKTPFNLFVKAKQDNDIIVIPLILTNGRKTDPGHIIHKLEVKIPFLKAGRNYKEKIRAPLDCCGPSLLSINTLPEETRLYAFNVLSSAEIIALYGIAIGFFALIGTMIGLLIRLSS